MKVLPRARARLGALVAALALAAATPALAEEGSGFTLGASGEASVYGGLLYPEEEGGGKGAPAAEARLDSNIRLSALSPSAQFRLSLGALARGDRDSGVDPSDYSDALTLEVREAEAAVTPGAAFALRGGILLRDLGAGAYGSPIDPFAREADRSGFWGLDAEWTPSSSLSATAIASADRVARSTKVSGVADYDGGTLVRFTPGAFDAALGMYASGAGDGELRPIGYASVPLASFLASLEAAASFPASGPSRRSSESIRLELRRSVDVGRATAELGAAYRGVYPGRDESGIEELLAVTPPEEIAYLPFAPFFGRHYAELSIALGRDGAYSLETDAIVALPKGGASYDAKAEVYVGDAGIFARATGVLGDGEFGLEAAASGLPGLELRLGMDISF